MCEKNIFIDTIHGMHHFLFFVLGINIPNVSHFVKVSIGYHEIMMI